MSAHLETVRSVFKKWVFIDDDDVIDLVLASVVANRFKDEPIWIFIVAPPANLKTEILLSLAGLPETHLLSKLTPKTLLSGFGKPEHSLLIRLQKEGKSVLLMKDFTTILEMEESSRKEIFAQLREVADGHMTYSTGGAAGDVHWKGHMGLLAGVTDVIDHQRLVKNSLGSRFLYYRLGIIDQKQAAIAAENNVGKREAWRGELSAAVKKFFSEFVLPSSIRDISVPPEILEKIISFAMFTARCRTDVDRDGYQRIVEILPTPEGPSRLARQFSVLARSIAAVRGKREAGEEELGIIRKLAFGTISKKRVSVISALYARASEETLSTREIAVEINLPVNTTKELLEDLSLLEIIHRQIEDYGGEDGSAKDATRAYLWRLDFKFREEVKKLNVWPDPVAGGNHRGDHALAAAGEGRQAVQEEIPF